QCCLPRQGSGLEEGAVIVTYRNGQVVREYIYKYVFVNPDDQPVSCFNQELGQCDRILCWNNGRYF
ncbi:MAG: hypothetical protein WC750_06630, partial [Patescibacteria group bacterium]